MPRADDPQAPRVPVLGLLTLLFALRVAAQALQRWIPTEVLPPFSAFQGSTLSYPLLLASQLVILALMVSGTWRVGTGRLVQRLRVARYLRTFALVYLAGSVLRILVGVLHPASPAWFSTWIPAFFHLVLASYVLIISECYAGAPSSPSRSGETWLDHAIYPASVVLAFTGYAALRALEVPLLMALYAVIFANSIWILVLERCNPEREAWRPQWSDVRVDLLYIASVQVVLPRLLGMGAALALAGAAHGLAPVAFWPHHWHWAAQTLIMILAVDFLRYWVHRACHHVPALWRLHEVHHSPRLLYSLNTSRFHPLEKLLHFSADTIPFLLIGVAPEVMAGYFLVYAVNGFYQHSNIRLRYGVLNCVVGSAQTHRWHHARDAHTAQCNFASTTALWDLLFGTWYLPRDTTVQQLGLMDERYPMGFWRQWLAPFRGT